MEAFNYDLVKKRLSNDPAFKRAIRGVVGNDDANIQKTDDAISYKLVYGKNVDRVYYGSGLFLKFVVSGNNVVSWGFSEQATRRIKELQDELGPKNAVYTHVLNIVYFETFDIGRAKYEVTLTRDCGTTANELLKNPHERLTVPEGLLMLNDLLMGLEFLHKDARLAHRDLHPTNFTLDRLTRRWTIIDFDTACPIERPDKNGNYQNFEWVYNYNFPQQMHPILNARGSDGLYKFGQPVPYKKLAQIYAGVHPLELLDRYSIVTAMWQVLGVNQLSLEHMLDSLSTWSYEWRDADKIPSQVRGSCNSVYRDLKAWTQDTVDAYVLGTRQQQTHWPKIMTLLHKHAQWIEQVRALDTSKKREVPQRRNTISLEHLENMHIPQDQVRMSIATRAGFHCVT